MVINEIKVKYNSFGDATIYKIEYSLKDRDSGGFYKDLIVYINCLNWLSEKWEKIKIHFIDVEELRFIETYNRGNTVIFEALMVQNGGKIIFDFFPIQVDGLGKLEEDLESNFSVHCNDLKYELLA